MIDRKVIIDIETTGLTRSGGHRIIEFCALELLNNEYTDKKLHLYFNPERDVPEDVIKIHGITLAELENKPKFADCMDEISDFIFPTKTQATTWVIHNAPFDIKFILNEFRLASRPLINYENIKLSEEQVYDTLVIARRRFPEFKKHNLDSLCTNLNIKKDAKHGALLDCLALYEVYKKLIIQKRFNA